MCFKKRQLQVESKKNITSFELMPYLLSNCETTDDVKKILADASILNVSFSEKLPAADLHQILSDKSGKSIVVESTKTGLHVQDNPVHVLTNNPEFPDQLIKLSDYSDVTPHNPKYTLIPNVDLNLYSRGFGTHHLPGGMDSSSRLVKVAFVLSHALLIISIVCYSFA